MPQQKIPQTNAGSLILSDFSDQFSQNLSWDVFRSVLFIGRNDDRLRFALKTNRMRYVTLTYPEIDPISTGMLLKSLFETNASSQLQMEQFQAVVASPSVIRYTPHTETLELFVQTAWSRVARGGRLYVLVHNEGGVSDWDDLLASASLETPEWDDWYADLLHLLTIGNLRATRVTVNLYSHSYNDLSFRLSHLYALGYGREQRNFFESERILSHLSMRKSAQRNNYYFPLEYIILEVTRS